MKNLLNKLVNMILDKTEQALIAPIAVQEIGISPLEANSLMPALYTGLWETQYVSSVVQQKWLETTV